MDKEIIRHGIFHINESDVVECPFSTFVHTSYIILIYGPYLFLHGILDIYYNSFMFGVYDSAINPT